MYTHTGVAATVSAAYEQRRTEKRPILLASTASPFKFAKSVMSAVDEKYAGEDDFKLLDYMCDLTGTDRPAAMKDIEHAPIRHNIECDVIDMEKMRNMPYRDYVISFSNEKDYKEFDTSKMEVLEKDDFELSLTIRVQLKDINEAVKEFRNRDIKSLTEKKHTLEEYFLNDVGGQNNE